MAKNQITKQTFPIADMSCAACAAKVDKVLNNVSGVSRAAVNFAAATALVEYDPAQCSPPPCGKPCGRQATT